MARASEPGQGAPARNAQPAPGEPLWGEGPLPRGLLQFPLPPADKVRHLQTHLPDEGGGVLPSGPPRPGQVELMGAGGGQEAPLPLPLHCGASHSPYL